MDNLYNIIINKTNEKIKYWTGITVDPRSKKFIKDLKELYNIIYSVEMINGRRDQKVFLDIIVNELTRKTITNLINELQTYKEEYVSQQQYLYDQQKPKLYTELNELSSQLDIPDVNAKYHVPEYIGVEEEIMEERKMEPPKTVKFVEKNIIVKLDSEKFENNGTLYNFTSDIENVKKIRIKSVSFDKSDYNINEYNNKMTINKTEIEIPEGCYKTIDKLIECIQKILYEIFGHNITIENNDITNKISISMQNNTKKINHNIQNLSALKNNINSENTLEIIFDGDLNKILGFSQKELKGQNSYIANNLFNLNIYSDVSLDIYANNGVEILKDSVINIKNENYLDTITRSYDNYVDFYGDLSSISVYFKYFNNKMYNFRGRHFNLTLEYIIDC